MTGGVGKWPGHKPLSTPYHVEMSLGNLNLRPSKPSQEENPVKIFEKLTLRGQVENLWAPQSEALIEWNKQRTANDVLIQMNTGGGKTLVGLLVAQALVNELRGRVLYVCPTNQLVEQAENKAAEVSLKVATYKERTWKNQSLYESCQVPCITNYAAVLNGKSIFSRQDVRAVLFDDAHVASNSIEAQFTLRVNRTDAVWDKLANLFRPYFSRSSQLQKYEDVRNGDNRYLLFVPHFEVFENVSAIREVLDQSGIASTGENIWAWEHLKDRLHLCVALISASGLDIVPPIPPVETLPIFAPTTRRIYLTATSPSKVELVRTFGISDYITISPGGKSGEAQRQIVFAAGSSDDEQREFAKELLRTHKAAIITPSVAASANWTDEALVLQVDETSVENFRNSDPPSKVVMPARYDGIDLPGETCRILVLDGLPSATTRYQRFLNESLRIERIRSQTTATRITQAMGRIFRSNTDHGAMVIVGHEIQNWLVDPNNLALLPALLQSQLQLGRALDEAVQSGATSHSTLLSAVLDGDQSWDEQYSKFVSGTVTVPYPDEQDWFVNVCEREHQAFVLMCNGNFQQAASIYSACAEEAATNSELRLFAWLRHWEGAALLASGDREQSFRAFVDAANQRVELGRPKPGPRLSHNFQRISNQAETVAARAKSGQDKVIRSLERIESLLSYDSSSAQVEEGVKLLADWLGLIASRPDHESGTGPDVLWLGPDKNSIGAWFELKTEKTIGSRYSKQDIGQTHDHKVWAATTYPDHQFEEALVGRLLEVSTESNPNPGLKIIELDAFLNLLTRLKDAYTQLFSDSSGNREHASEAALRGQGLKWPECATALPCTLAVDLKRQRD